MRVSSGRAFATAGAGPVEATGFGAGAGGAVHDRPAHTTGSDAPAKPAACTPVLLLPGWNGRAREMRHIERLLHASGWDRESVEVLQFREICGSNIEHAEEIAGAVDAVLGRTRSDRIDIVAHSMGGLATRWYMARGPDPTPVRRAVFIGTPHAGTWLAWAAWGRGGREMRPGSPFLRDLDDAGLPDGVTTFTIRTLLETRVWPVRSARLGGADDFHVRLATHPGLLRSRPVLRRILECLA